MAAVNGKLISEMTLLAYNSGLWILECDCDRGEFAFGSTANLTVGEDKWVGWVESHDVWLGNSRLRIIGGKFPKRVKSESYRSAQIGQIASSIIRDGGQAAEVVDAPQVIVPSWSRLAGSYVSALDELSRTYGLSYRALPDGKIWFGINKYPAAKTDFLQTEDDTRFNEVVYAVDRLVPYPNCTFDGKKITSVTYRIDGNSMTARCQYA